MPKIKLLTLTACGILFALQMAGALNLPPQITNYLQTQHLLDEGGRPLPFCDATQTGTGDLFVQYTMANWSVMLDNLSSIAPEPRQQRLIIRAIESLPGRTYLNSLNKLCDLEIKGIITSETLEFAVHGRYPKNGFLSNNYQDPQVVQLAQRLQSVLPKDSKEQGLLTDILSGKQKGIDQDGAGEAGTPPPATLPPQ